MPAPPYSLASKVGSYPNIHEIPGAGITIAQTLPEPQGYALHVPDQVNFSGADHFTPPQYSLRFLSCYVNSKVSLVLD